MARWFSGFRRLLFRCRRLRPDPHAQRSASAPAAPWPTVSDIQRFLGLELLADHTGRCYLIACWSGHVTPAPLALVLDAGEGTEPFKVLLYDGRCSWLRSRFPGKQEDLIGYLGISPRHLPTTLSDDEPVVPRKIELYNASAVASQEEM